MPFGAELTEGGVRFALWAPAARNIAVDADGEYVPMEGSSTGWFRTMSPRAHAGTRYRFIVDGRIAVPDPASRFQPEGVHGASEVIDPAGYRWSGHPRKAQPWHELVFYELHIGTFTPEGTYRAAIGRLDDLVTLGVSAVELMPVAQSAGRRNWGYDGAYPFAPANAYGRPGDLKALIEAAHARGLCVFLDVVYNHFGPEGNYLREYAPAFFTDREKTPWGSAIDFTSHPEPRQFFVHNALYWTEEFAFDGLRLDAVHAIDDDSRPNVLTEIASALTHNGRSTGDGRAYAVLENDRNSVRLLRSFGAQWDDDAHHALHVLLTNERDGYYADYSAEPARLLGRALTEGFAYQGERSAFRGARPRGEPSAALQPTSFVTFLQNHDQVGNRAFGERIAALAGYERQRAAAALLLLAPSLPLLFMGEEWCASSPFLFFCDFEPQLSALVRAGRRREFSSFLEFAGLPVDALADAGSPDTFLRSKLNWHERAREPHRSMLEFYQTLLRLRRDAVFPLLRRPRTEALLRCHGAAPAFAALWRFEGAGGLTVTVNLGDEPLEHDTLSFEKARGDVLLAIGDRKATAEGALAPWSVTWRLLA